MRAIIVAAIAACFAIPASAGGAIFKSRTTTIRLSETPCSGFVATLVEPADVPKMKTAEVVHRDRAIAACWFVDGEKVLLVDADGDSGFLMLTDFKPDDGV
jgi:hypothetical protein